MSHAKQKLMPNNALHRPPATFVIGLASRATPPPNVGAGELKR
ncbi:MAG: hypothetical protein WBN32_09865 [Woeseia sp.]